MGKEQPIWSYLHFPGARGQSFSCASKSLQKIESDVQPWEHVSGALIQMLGSDKGILSNELTKFTSVCMTFASILFVAFQISSLNLLPTLVRTIIHLKLTNLFKMAVKFIQFSGPFHSHPVCWLVQNTWRLFTLRLICLLEHIKSLYIDTWDKL